MLAWKKVALEVRAASVPLRTGTMSVEKIWALFYDYVPKSTTRISLRFFRILAQLVLIRFNIVHFTSGNLPGWVDGDTLLHQRLDAADAALRLLMGGGCNGDGDSSGASALFDPFLAIN